MLLTFAIILPLSRISLATNSDTSTNSCGISTLWFKSIVVLCHLSLASCIRPSAKTPDTSILVAACCELSVGIRIPAPNAGNRFDTIPAALIGTSGVHTMVIPQAEMGILVFRCA
jgi:hypothetical protein